MNCKYCGAALPTKGGTCPECGRMIPVDQMVQRKNNLDPTWYKFRDPNTAFYKQETAYDPDTKVGKIVVIIVLILLILLIIAIVKGTG